MKFTVVFPSHENNDLCIGAVFVPCLVWMEGERQILSPHSQNPSYVKGDLRKLLLVKSVKSRISDHTKKVTVVAHSIGYGTQQDLDNLVSDLESKNFVVTTVHQ